PVLASLAIFDEAGMPALRDKSILLTGFMAELLQTCFADTVAVITPANPAERGCQLSLTIRPGTVSPRTVFERLDAANVIGDWREPDAIRIAPTPLYNRFGDVVEFARRLAAALDGG
ncbi:MAG: kynureninase, partial [Pseudomonadota bacterium]